MSSLLEKLKALVNATVRGPQRLDPGEGSTAAKPEKTAEGQPLPEVTEGSTAEKDLPEVSEAPLPTRTATVSPAAPQKRQSDASARIAASEESPEETRELEEGRVVDLLKDQDQ
jgi:hypothetical protein